MPSQGLKCRAIFDKIVAILPLADEKDDACDLSLRYSGREITAAEDDYFEAMCSIRLILENDGLIPCYYGASRYACPPSMSEAWCRCFKFSS